MNSSPDQNKSETDSLVQEITRLREELETLNGHSFIQRQNSFVRVVLAQFVRGIAYGFGWVVGATILVSFVVYLLSTIDFIPVVGGWASEIADMIQDNH